MPMSKEEHNALLEKLLNPDMEHSERTELLQTLRTDYGVFHADHESIVGERDKLRADKDDLVVSNSKLFRQLGTQDTSGNQEPKEVEKDFSESITITALEKG